MGCGASAAHEQPVLVTDLVTSPSNSAHAEKLSRLQTDEAGGTEMHHVISHADEDEQAIATLVESYVGDMDTRLVIDIFDERAKERRLSTVKDMAKLQRCEEAATARLATLSPAEAKTLEIEIERTRTLRDSIFQFDSYLNRMEARERERLIKAIQKIHGNQRNPFSSSAHNEPGESNSAQAVKEAAPGLVLDMLDGIPVTPTQQKRRNYHLGGQAYQALGQGLSGFSSGDRRSQRRHTMAAAADAGSAHAIAAAVAAASRQHQQQLAQQQWQAQLQGNHTSLSPQHQGSGQAAEDAEQPKRGRLGKPKRLTQKGGFGLQDPQNTASTTASASAAVASNIHSDSQPSNPTDDFKQRTLAMLLGPRPLRRSSIAVDFIMPAPRASVARDEDIKDPKVESGLASLPPAHPSAGTTTPRTLSRTQSRSSTPNLNRHPTTQTATTSLTTDVIPTSNRRGSIVNVSPGAAILMTPTPQLIANAPILTMAEVMSSDTTSHADVGRSATPISHTARRASLFSNVSTASATDGGALGPGLGRRGSLIAAFGSGPSRPPPPSPGGMRRPLALAMARSNDQYETSGGIESSIGTGSVTLITPLVEPSLVMSAVTSYGMGLGSRQGESRRGSLVHDDMGVSGAESSAFISSAASSIDGRDAVSPFRRGSIARRSSLGLGLGMTANAEDVGSNHDAPPPNHRLQDMLNPISLRRLSHSTDFFDPLKALGEDPEAEAAAAPIQRTVLEVTEEKESQ